MIEHTTGNAQRADNCIGRAVAAVERDNVAAARSGVADLQRRERSGMDSADRLICSAVESNFVAIGIERSVVRPVAADRDIRSEVERCAEIDGYVV